jgi:hypothetical protein
MTTKSRRTKEREMPRKMSLATALLAAWAVVLAITLIVATPALAHHKEGHEQGSGHSESQAKDNDGDADSTEGQTTEANDGDADDQTDPNVDEDDNAHPSGKDRSVENGGGNQGNSESNPDDSKGPMRFEGSLGDDKPGGPGGTDLADQDGNNGCGNDDDFDDDNNGWCGKPEDEVPPPPPGGGTVDRPSGESNFGSRTDTALPEEEEVLGLVTHRATPDIASATADRVLGGVLPFTGAGITLFFAAGLALVGSGTVLTRFSRRR